MIPHCLLVAGGEGWGELLAVGTKLILICVILYVIWGFCLPSRVG